jgi:hypothetical protein
VYPVESLQSKALRLYLAMEIISTMSTWNRSTIVMAVALTLALSAVAAKQFVMPRALPAADYPAHDTHPTEKVSIGADPYDSKDKEKQLFVGDYLDHSFLPVFIVVSNDGDKPIALTNIRVELLTRDRAKAPAINDADLYRRFTNTKRYQDKSSGSRRLPYPIPLPKKDQGGVKKELREEFDAAQFFAKAVEPHGSQSGFMFFDIGGLDDPARGASITITGVKDGDGNPLMFFEVPLDKYVNAPKPATVVSH